MSHSRGLFQAPCRGSFKKYGRPRDGLQQIRCGSCGEVRLNKVRRCLLWHSYVKKGKPKYGNQIRVCRVCGHRKNSDIRPCWFFHHWSRSRKHPIPRCKRCGIQREEPGYDTA